MKNYVTQPFALFSLHALHSYWKWYPRETCHAEPIYKRDALNLILSPPSSKPIKLGAVKADTCELKDTVFKNCRISVYSLYI